MVGKGDFGVFLKKKVLFALQIPYLLSKSSVCLLLTSPLHKESNTPYAMVLAEQLLRLNNINLNHLVCFNKLMGNGGPAERERETERDRGRERQRERETEGDRERERETERDRDRERGRERERERERR